MGKSFFLLACAIFLSHSFAHTYIGNSGEGIQINEKLYLRELYESNNYENPYFGSIIDPQIQVLVENESLSKLSFSKELLKRKLSDINKIENFWGHYLMEALNQYNWVLVDDPLGQLPTDGPILDLPESARVQIANRDLTTIRIHRASWKRLSDAHKIALIVHEGFFSLLKPSCPDAATGSCLLLTQSSRLARAIAAFFFQSQISQKLIVPDWIKESLYLPLKVQLCPHGQNDFRLSANFKNFNLQNGKDLTARNLLIQNACYSFFKNAKRPVTVQVSLARDPFYLSTNSYLASYGLQVAIQVGSRPWFRESHLSFANAYACIKHLQFLTNQWYEKNMDQDGVNQCMSD